jgi:hypothetical protein
MRVSELQQGEESGGQSYTPSERLAALTARCLVEKFLLFHSQLCRNVQKL